MLKGKGNLIYDPHRGSMTRNIKWWVVLQGKSMNGIAEYYADQIRKNPYWYGETKIDIKLPSWGNHISIVRGEKPKNIEAWKKYHNKTFEFSYSPEIRRGGDTGPGRDDYWFLDVHCPELMEVRKELGLPTKTWDGKPYRFHLSVGKL